MLDYNPNVMNLVNSAEQLGRVNKVLEEQKLKKEKVDTAILQTVDESKKQNKLLSMQVDELKEQKRLIAQQVDGLKEQNQLLQEMYDNAKAESIESKKQAKQNKIFGWVSFAVGTIIGILGVVLGIIF